MRKFLLPTVVIVAFLWSHQAAHGQSTCAQTLRSARLTYDQGRLHELPDMLSGCLTNGFTRQEKVEAYKLLVLSYIYLEEPSKADEAMLNLLYTDSYFEINPEADPAEFIALYKTFRTWPIYRYGAKIGVNATRPNVVQQENAIEGSTANYSSNINFQVGAVFEIPLTPKLTLNPELYFQLKSFSYNSTLPVNAVDNNHTEGTESQSWASLPISLQYGIKIKKIDTYVGLGVSTDFLLGSTLTINRARTNANSLQEQTIDITSGRNPINISAIVSAGLKFKLGGGFVVGEIRYYYGLTTINTVNSAYTLNDYLLFDNAYADNQMKLNSLSITAGYIVNVFNPKKLRARK